MTDSFHLFIIFVYFDSLSRFEKDGGGIEKYLGNKFDSIYYIPSTDELMKLPHEYSIPK